MELHTNEKPWDLLVIVLLTASLVAIITVTPDSVLRPILGLPFLLFFPGYALVSALFPENTVLDHVERIALSFGLSIALTPLVGLLLNYTWIISLTSILVSLSVLILGLCGMAYLRREGIPLDERFDVDLRLNMPDWEDYDTIDKLLVVGTVVLLISSVVLAAYIVVTPRQGERFTELYILGPEGMADGYQTHLQVNESSHLIIGVVNREHEDMEYELVIGLGHEPDTMENTGGIPDDFQFALYNNTYRSVTVPVPDGSRWEQHANISVSEPGQYRLGIFLTVDGSVYRRVHLWVTVTEGD